MLLDCKEVGLDKVIMKVYHSHNTPYTQSLFT